MRDHEGELVMRELSPLVRRLLTDICMHRGWTYFVFVDDEERDGVWIGDGARPWEEGRILRWRP